MYFPTSVFDSLLFPACVLLPTVEFIIQAARELMQSRWRGTSSRSRIGLRPPQSSWLASFSFTTTVTTRTTTRMTSGVTLPPLSSSCLGQNWSLLSANIRSWRDTISTSSCSTRSAYRTFSSMQNIGQTGHLWAFESTLNVRRLGAH